MSIKEKIFRVEVFEGQMTLTVDTRKLERPTLKRMFCERGPEGELIVKGLELIDTWLEH